MKKRTAVFGYTKGFQRRIAHAQALSRHAGTLTGSAAKALFDQANQIVASVKKDHRERQRKLREANAK